ncbi:MAG: type I DNA topoisomerase [Bacteroidales bacterium]|nr:type I DNA topoisomerase [Bacteroidales bacterium]
MKIFNRIMEGNLVIVESPAKAKTIQKFLGDGFTVKSSFGHICDLQDKALSIDIENGFKPEYVIPSDKKKVVAELKTAAAGAQTVWLASDEDREGEAISWHLSQTLGLDPARTRRIVFHEITREAILHAVQNPREIDINLVNAQQARRVLDRLVGFELSPLLWRKVQRGLSAGRVQSVALRLVVDREKEIIGFKSEKYYRVEAVFNVGGNRVKGLLDTRFGTLEQARGFLEDSIGAIYRVASVEKKEILKMPAAPFTTSTLQQEASRKLHFSVSQTMRIAQGLYEKGLITYMRTDSTNLSQLAISTCKKLITDNFGPEYLHSRQFRTQSKGAQEAHEAIRPTYIANESIEGTEQEKKLYNLIWKRTVASQMAEARMMSTTIRVSSDKRSEGWTIQAGEILFEGFLKLYLEGSDDQEEQEETILPPVKEGDFLDFLQMNAECKFTQAPYRYSEATLIKKLEELGIGRPSTYAPTINTLTSERGYITKGDKEGRKIQVNNLTMKNGRIDSSVKTETVGAERGKLLPQDIGIIVSDYLVANFSDIVDYDFTANVEKEFDLIADGKIAWNSQISRFYFPFHEKVKGAMSDRQFSNKVQRELGVDPADGQMVIAKFGQYGAYVQKGEGENKQFANMNKGQLIESITLEEALNLFRLPRTVGEYEGAPVIVSKGRFGPYIKYGDRNIPLPKKADPMKVTLENCIEAVRAENTKPRNAPVKEFPNRDICIMTGPYGPYIKHAGGNYKLPDGTDPAALSEEDCIRIVNEGTPTGGKKNFRKFKTKK